MLEINLLPEELKKKESRFKKFDIPSFNPKDLPVLKILIAAGAGLIALQLILFAAELFGKANFSGINKKYGAISPEKKEADALKLQVDMINSKIGAIDELMVKRFGWAKKLNELSDSVTPGIWLSQLYYEEKAVDRPVSDEGKAASKPKKDALKPKTEKILSKYIAMSGYASSMGEDGAAAVGRFIKGLKDNKTFYADFSDIELGNIKRDKVENQEVMSFNIVCYFRETK